MFVRFSESSDSKGGFPCIIVTFFFLTFLKYIQSQCELESCEMADNVIPQYYADVDHNVLIYPYSLYVIQLPRSTVQ